MILRNLVLKNFRKFKYSVIEFPDGVTGIAGLNGVGKSTIFEAIAWVLYGAVAARTSADQIKRGTASHSDPCRVELEFIFEEDNYRIMREMTGKSLAAHASVTVNGKQAAQGAETVSKYIQKKLGMDFKSFFTSIFAKQKELNTLSSMNAGDRRPLILRMLGIDEVDEIIKEVRADKKHKISLLERRSSDLVDETGESKIEQYHCEIKDLKKRQKNIEVSIKQSKNQLIILNQEFETLRQLYENTKKEYETINQYKEKLAEKKILFETRQRLQEDIKKLEQKIQQRYQVIRREREKIKDFEDLEENINQVETRIGHIDEQIEHVVKLVEQKNTLMENNKKEILKLDSKRKEIERLGPSAECPTCERPLGEQYDRLIKKIGDERNQKNRDVTAYVEAIKREQEKKESFDREKDALQKKKKYHQNRLREKERITTTITNINTEIEGERKDVENRQTQLGEIQTVTFNLEEYTRVKNRVSQVYKKLDFLQADVHKKQNQLNHIELQLAKYKNDKKLVYQSIQHIQERITELHRVEKQIEEEKKNARNLSMLHEVMSSFRTYLISRIRPTLASYASDFFARLTDGKYREIELNDDYDLLVYDNGNSYGIRRFSGGEEDLANLCLRLAISEVITERAGGVFNFIILDEIFGSQDRVRRQNIMKALNSLSSKFRQIFLITHVEDVKNYMENIIYVTENENGISNVKLE
jgi:exonuclease SbcC